MLFLNFIFYIFNLHAVSLIQEQNDIECLSSESKKILINKKDSFFNVGNKKYKAVEFLDTAILAKNNNEYALIQMLQNDEAYLVSGFFSNFAEKNCNDTGASKTCSNKNFHQLYWSSSKLNMSIKPQKTDKMKVIRYGVYPNDGTYFIASNESSGQVIIDYGSKLQTVYGSFKKLKCSYLEE